MKILICLEGNILDPKNDFAFVKEANKKVNNWVEKGAQVEFLTDVSKFVEVKKLNDKLKEMNLGELKIHAKQENERFVDLLNEVKPNVFIENKENSSEEQSIAERADESLQMNAILLEPLQGIDHLPDDLEDLKEFGKKEEIVPDEED